jgi:hypothetical protein
MADERGPQSWWQTLPGVITAITGLVTAIAGLIVVVNKVLHPDPKPPSAPTPAAVAGIPATAVPPMAVPAALPTAAAVAANDERIAAKELALNYWNALIHSDARYLMEHSSAPFFTNDGLLLSTGDLRNWFQQHSNPSVSPSPIPSEKIQIESRSLGEWKSHGGVDLSKVADLLDLTDDNFMVSMDIPKGKFSFFTRRKGNDLTIAGVRGEK